jgi:hypothetical protein
MQVTSGGCALTPVLTYWRIFGSRSGRRGSGAYATAEAPGVDSSFSVWSFEASNNPPNPETKYKQRNRRAKDKGDELGRILTSALLLCFCNRRDVVA